MHPVNFILRGICFVLEHGQPRDTCRAKSVYYRQIDKTDTQGSIRSSLTNHFPIPWTRRNGKVFIDERENPFAYVVQAMTITEKYAVALGKRSPSLILKFKVT